jgi:predicted kinase
MKCEMPGMIIIVAGLPGSGKSYFAEKLAAKLGVAYVNSDVIRKEIDARGKYSLKEKLVVYEKMAGLVKEILKEQPTVVVDATFYHDAMRKLFHTIAKECSSGICWIHVTASEALIRARLRKPRVNSEADFGVYQEIRDEFEAMTMPHLTLESANDNIIAMLTKAVAYIKNVHESVSN